MDPLFLFWESTFARLILILIIYHFKNTKAHKQRTVTKTRDTSGYKIIVNVYFRSQSIRFLLYLGTTFLQFAKFKCWKIHYIQVYSHFRLPYSPEHLKRIGDWMPHWRSPSRALARRPGSKPPYTNPPFKTNQSSNPFSIFAKTHHFGTICMSSIPLEPSNPLIKKIPYSQNAWSPWDHFSRTIIQPPTKSK